MGLFDKLKEAVGNAIESSMNGPMNENEKKYYDIILNLLLSVPHLQKEHIQKFIEVKYNENCDEATLCKVLEKFETVTEPKTKETWYQLTSTQSSRASYKDGGLSWFKKEEIYDICFDDFREEIRLKFKEIFEVVKATPSKRILDQGVSKIIEVLPSGYAGGDDYPNYQMAVKVIGQEITKLFFDGDCLIKEIISDEALSWLKYDYKNQSYNYTSHVYAFALRAFHYKKSDKTSENYVSITLTDCKDVITQSETYQEKINDNPFDKESILNNASEAILECNIILAPSKIEWLHWAIQDTKLVDAACFFAWERVSSEYEDIADNVEDVACMLHNYIENNAE